MGGMLSLIGDVVPSSLIGDVRGPSPSRRPGERIGFAPGSGALVDSGECKSSDTVARCELDCGDVLIDPRSGTTTSCGEPPKSSNGSAANVNRADKQLGQPTIINPPSSL
jgi:hypothetical protein